MIEPRPSLRVLCADDNILVLDMLAKTLQSAGHHVEVAIDGRAAIARVKEDPSFFQLIVTDTRMPRLDGFGVVEQARSAGFSGKIIVFANALSAEDRQRYFDLQVDRVIDKPGKAGELVGAINELQASLVGDFSGGPRLGSTPSSFRGRQSPVPSRAASQSRQG